MSHNAQLKLSHTYVASLVSIPPLEAEPAPPWYFGHAARRQLVGQGVFTAKLIRVGAANTPDRIVSSKIEAQNQIGMPNSSPEFVCVLRRVHSASSPSKPQAAPLPLRYEPKAQLAESPPRAFSGNLRGKLLPFEPRRAGGKDRELRNAKYMNAWPLGGGLPVRPRKHAR